MNTLFTLFKVIERSASKGWRGTLESTRRLMGIFSKILITVFGKLSKGHCLAAYAMSREILRLYRKSGALMTGQYLKQVAFCLMWYTGGDRELRPKLKVFISLTRSGIPKIIPPYYRKIIRNGSDPRVVKVILSICTLSRLFLVPPKGGIRVNPSTIHIKNFQLSESCKNLCKKFVSSGFSMVAGYAPTYVKIPLRMGFNFKPTFSSGPNTYKRPDRESSVVFQDKKSVEKLTIFHTLPIDATALMTLFKPEDLSVLGSIWFHDREVIPDCGYDAPVLPEREGTLGFGWLINSLILPAQEVWWDKMITRPELGRFGRKLEGSGKVRLFAIASPILQALVRPLHDWVMQVLSTIPMDGTYDQHAPLERLKGKQYLYSFDLKSATDLLPVDLSGSLLVSLFGDEFGQTWCFLMSMVGFRSPDPCSSPLRARVYRFTRGQPLGYYSSWPVFTLTHHVLVWLAAWRAYPGKLFKDYAILGDDLVIADTLVAAEYRKIMDEAMGVISMDKSLVSSKGACEFAKRFIINNHRPDRTDLSPISVPLLKSLSGFVSSFVFQKLGCSLRNSFRLRGGGYHVFSKIRDNSRNSFPLLSRRWQRHWLTLYTPSGILPLPWELWFMFPYKGYMDCYSLGMVRSFILERVAPKDLDEKSFDRLRAFWVNDEDNMLERILQSFLKLHLSYLQWYASVIFDYTLPLSTLLNPPVSPRRIARTSDESLLKRYGIAFKAWDYLRTHQVSKPLESGDKWNYRDITSVSLYKFNISYYRRWLSYGLAP